MSLEVRGLPPGAGVLRCDDWRDTHALRKYERCSKRARYVVKLDDNRMAKVLCGACMGKARELDALSGEKDAEA